MKFEILQPPKFEINKGLILLNEQAVKNIGSYTHVFYSKHQKTVLLKPCTTKDDQSFDVVNGTIDISHLLDESYEKTTMKRTNDGFKLPLKPKQGFEQITPPATYNDPFSTNETSFLNPSEVTNVPWLSVFASEIPKPKDMSICGKWLIFCNDFSIEKTWAKIAQATIDNQLSFGAKCSTGMSNSEFKVICVYTQDTNDEDDVMRIRKILRKLGITKKIAYKTNEATKKGLYASEGQRVSKYWC
jgi:hypothetical protein